MRLCVCARTLRNLAGVCLLCGGLVLGQVFDVADHGLESRADISPSRVVPLVSATTSAPSGAYNLVRVGERIFRLST